MERYQLIELVDGLEKAYHNSPPIVEALGEIKEILKEPELKVPTREQVKQMRSRWITVAGVNGQEYSKCADCQNGLDGLEDAYLFCPNCGRPMTDAAVEIVMERLEAVKDGL